MFFLEKELAGEGVHILNRLKPFQCAGYVYYNYCHFVPGGNFGNIGFRRIARQIPKGEADEVRTNHRNRRFVDGYRCGDVCYRFYSVPWE